MTSSELAIKKKQEVLDIYRAGLLKLTVFSLFMGIAIIVSLFFGDGSLRPFTAVGLMFFIFGCFFSAYRTFSLIRQKEIDIELELLKEQQ